MADTVPDALWAAECREDMAVERMEREARGRTCGECDRFAPCPCGCSMGRCEAWGEWADMDDGRCDAEHFSPRR